MKNIKKTIILSLLIFTFVIPIFAIAQADSKVPAIETIRNEKYGATELGYDTSGVAIDKLRNTRNIIIKTILGFIGAFFLVLIIWGGYDWMFSGGNEERVTNAKKRIKMAVNGLIIVLLSYMLTSFIIDALFKSTIRN